ncbi:hypothetical protein DTO207G8_4949 [Paecilomyces variotii]|nr:hypothetical protein DTO207G8_4949 [Paecilomyces variotii]
MAVLDVPDTGLSLRRDQPDGLSPGPSARTTQIMRLNLAQSTLDELVQSLRNEQKARIRLGRHQTLYYGSKAQHFRSSPEAHRSEIYSANPADKENMYFTGVLSHNLEVQKAKEDTAATDEALANLELSLNAFERGKESKKTHMITNILDVKALGAGDNRSSTGKQAARLARMPTSKIDVEKERFFKNAANRSIPTSPALGVTRSPVPALTSTSAPSTQNKDRIRLEALKVPFIHLLAIRAVSVKFLARQTRSSQEDCQALARKYGTENRLDRDKFDLKDKAYRDLDVWNFPYPSQEDRQEAIENAISAFDRMRISRSDKLWQMLLPKEERGKGKVLSRLDLSKGPIKKAVTPRIHIQPSEDTGKEGYVTGNETDRTNGRHTPNTTAGKLTPKLGATTQKKRVGDKDGPAKRASTKAKNTTLTGRVTKKTEKKPTAKPDGKFKSAEYVHDSDEDDTDMADAPPPRNPELEKVRPASAVASKAPTPSKVATDSRSSAQKAPKQEAERANPKPSSSTSGTTGSKTLPSSSRPSNSSPQKPSPLASSPPTNASDLDSASSKSVPDASSSSSSPLITQISKNKPSGDASRVTKPSVKVNGTAQRPQGTGNPLKRKAGIDHDTSSTARMNGHINGHLEAKRRRPPSVSSGSSTGSASPPLSQELLRQQLREKSQKFKQYYTKYRALHETLASQPNPPRAELDKLERQHTRLQLMKKEIWDEDRRLRSGL